MPRKRASSAKPASTSGKRRKVEQAESEPEESQSESEAKPTRRAPSKKPARKAPQAKSKGKSRSARSRAKEEEEQEEEEAEQEDEEEGAEEEEEVAEDEAEDEKEQKKGNAGSKKQAKSTTSSSRANGKNQKPSAASASSASASAASAATSPVPSAEEEADGDPSDDTEHESIGCGAAPVDAPPRTEPVRVLPFSAPCSAVLCLPALSSNSHQFRLCGVNGLIVGSHFIPKELDSKCGNGAFFFPFLTPCTSQAMGTFSSALILCPALCRSTQRTRSSAATSTHSSHPISHSLLPK
jgi:hypothetical protein